jgi:peptide-methionine (S)-S-oxide reductase
MMGVGEASMSRASSARPSPVRAAIGIGVLVAMALVGRSAVTRAADNGVALPAPAVDSAPTSARSDTAVLAGGCFWGIQAVFEHVNGVSRVIAGYSGGTLRNPTYEQVSTETSGHAESVRVTYDPTQVTFGALLQVFFSVGHDPTQLNRQGPDLGPSYRSNIFYTSDDQKRVAEAYIAQLNAARVFARPLVTRVDRFTEFYPAEDYHQDFLITHPTYPYIVINDLPKLENFKRLLPGRYRPSPVTVSGAAPAVK